VQVLLLVVGGLGVNRGLIVGLGFPRHPAITPERGYIGEDLQDRGLGGQQTWVADGQPGPRDGQPPQLPGRLPLVDVVAQHHRAQRGQRVGSGRRGIPVVFGNAGQRAQVGPCPLGAGLPAAAGCRVLLDPDQLGARLDLRVDLGQHLGYPARSRGAQRRLQFHALHDGDHVAFGDLVSGRDGDGHHHRRARGGDQPGLATGDPVYRAIDLDQVVRPLRDREYVEVLAASGEGQLEPARSLDVGFYRVAVQAHPVPGRPGPGHP
jgi:hypothetical protein